MNNLLNHSNVHYAYSTDPNFNADKRAHAEYEVISFVPDYHHEGSELTPLKGAELEADALQKTLGGLRFFGEEANRSNFFEFGTKAKILHMAMHTEVFDHAPMESHFAFDGTTELSHHLQARELFELNLAAELVVLSGCQTGAGKLSRGEGRVEFIQSIYLCRLSIRSNDTLDDGRQCQPSDNRSILRKLKRWNE